MLRRLEHFLTDFLLRVHPLVLGGIGIALVIVWLLWSLSLLR